MVNPIDYTMDVLSPIEGYMQGLKFGEGIQTDRLNRELAQSQEGRAQETFAMQNRDREAARANAARQRAQAEASQAALADLAAKGLSATSDDFVAAWVANPAIRADLGQLQTMLQQPQMTALKNANQNIYSAASTNNPSVVARLLEEQIAVAQSPGGDPSVVDSLQFSLDLLTEDPEGGLAQIRATTGLTLLGLTSPEYMKRIDETLGVGGGGELPAEVRELQFRADAAGLVEGTTEYQDFMRTGGAVPPVEKLGFRAATAEEAALFGATSGQIDQDSGRFYKIDVPSGMSLTVDEDGNISFVEGPGAGAGEKPFTEGQSKDVVFVTRARGALAEFNPVADKLTSRSEILLDIIPLGLGREYQDPDYQVAQRSGTEFLQAILRKDTGAAITPAEQEEYGKVYLPQPGDSAAILKSRAEARNRAVAALEAGMSSTQMLAVERASGLVSETTAQPPAAVPANNATNRFSSMDQSSILSLDISQLSNDELILFSLRMDELGL